VIPSGPDVDDAARIRWPFTTRPSNIARLRQGWRAAAEIARASGLLLRTDELDEALARSDDEIDQLIVETHTAFYHGVGTCRMGDDGDDRVVDLDCRVLGVEGLRICDASVIPTVPRSNTNVAVMAVAERFVQRERLTTASPVRR